MNILANYPPILEAQSFAPTDGIELIIKYEDLANQYDWVQINFKDINNKPVENLNNGIKDKTGIYVINLDGFEITEVYKGQIRFVKFDENNKNVITAASEWSGWFLFKRVHSPNNNDIKIAFDKAQTPYLIGIPQESFYAWSKENKENIDKYKFIIKLEDETIEESNWTQCLENKEYGYQVETELELNKEYQIKFIFQTLNGYEYTINQTFTPTDNKDIISIGLNVNCDIDPEEGTIQVFLNKEDDIEEDIINRVYAISRTSSKSNYTKWEQLTEFVLEKEGLAYIDYTVEDGIGYQYAVQRIQNADGGRTGRVISNQVEAQLNYTYLWDGRAQLKLKYNNKISNLKHNILATKQDTIGSKYPIIYRNGDINYLEFPISGLISLHLDENHNFFTYDETNGYYCNNQLVIPIDKLKDPITKEVLGFDTNLTSNNIFIERVFREKVEDFLNNGKEKLYRSPTEGNVLVYLMNVSLTPNQQLGRMISEFSATAVEIEEASIKHMRELQWIKTEFTKEERDAIYVYGFMDLNDTINSDLGDSYLESLNSEYPIKDIYVDNITPNGNLKLQITNTNNTTSTILVLAGTTYNVNSYIKDLKILEGEGILVGRARYKISPFINANNQTYSLFRGINQIVGEISNTNSPYEDETITTNPLNLLALALFFANEVKFDPDKKIIAVGFTLNKIIFGNISDKIKLKVNGKEVLISGNVSDYTIDYKVTNLQLLEGTFGSFYYEFSGYQETEESGS